MAAITGTKTDVTRLSKKAMAIITATLGSASDTITLTKATHGISAIDFVAVVLEGGADAALLAGLQVSFSGLVITVVSQAENGTAATNWTDAAIRLLVIGDT